jgi:methionine-S-sulfoxide reductase
MSGNIQMAMFGAGCFWGVESEFAKVPGVVETEVGYSGGRTSNPTYEEVCFGVTGHAEVLRISFDSEVISYPELLELFFKIHDPTQLNRQGPDIGVQYRSAIFVYSEEQQQQALSMIMKLETECAYDAPIVTEIIKAPLFYRAEEYHQRYFEKQGKIACNR